MTEVTQAVAIMGIVNVTPDSFSDGGHFFEPDQALNHAFELLDAGADIIDLGGESTRPGSDSVQADEEQRRLLPVIEKVLAQRPDAYISVDTVKPAVAEAALKLGARMINDVSMLREGGRAMAEAVARHDAEVVLMHSRKQPKDMQREIHYDDLFKEICGELAEAIELAESAGVDPDKIWIDPGIGFAKTPEQCIEILAGMERFHALGKKILVGPSRKSFIGHYSDAPADERLGGTAAAVVASVLAGAQGVRVHDVAVMKQATMVAELIRSHRRGGAG